MESPPHRAAAPSNPAAPPAPATRGRRRLGAFAVAALSAACYLNTLPNGFVFDDETVIVYDRTVRELRHPAVHFSTPYWGGSLLARREPIGTSTYRPLATLSFAVDYALWGLQPWGYHLTSLLVHALATLAVLGLLRRLTGPGPLPEVAAALFAVHPVHTEAVAGAAFRPELLSALFGLLALDAYAASLPAPLCGDLPPAPASPPP
ncbi:MAG: hypothetical protein HZA54_19960, partial [Planctomycetes bacterium]|nr:hypothetical protein [Planctomycetota bacterium]